ncbi:hypothetical protein LH51_05100 [Nitrincola sp. A-D6]|nr:hypothetical protein LH51_05100 [Nitrincola sp. A-D6]
MAGLAYINFLPGVVNALAGGIGFNEAEAGQIVALNGYGSLLGCIVSIFMVRCFHWQPVMLVFLTLLALVDIGTIWVDDYTIMLGWRFLAGLLGGLCVGIGFSVLARLNNPDRAFGTLLFIQFSIGSIVMYGLPALEELLNAHAVFYVMAGFIFISLVLIPFLPALPLSSQSISQSMPLAKLFGKPVLLLLAIVLYLTAASAIYAYVGLIGLGASLTSENISTYIAITGMLGLLGAMIPVISGKRVSRIYMVVTGIAMSILAAILLNFSHFTSLYVVAMSLLFFSWPAVQSYLFAVTAEMDNSGRLSTIAAVVSFVGLATGPLLASSLLNDGSFAVMLYTCAMIFLLSFLLLFKPVKAQAKAQDSAFSSQP